MLVLPFLSYVLTKKKLEKKKKFELKFEVILFLLVSFKIN